MKRVVICFVLIHLVLVGRAFGQSAEGQVDRRVVIVPASVVLPVVASQPDCPLQIEDVKFFKYLSGGGNAETYRVRNKGTKSIRSYTIGAWNTVGTGWENEHVIDGTLLPNQVFVPTGGYEVEVVELTESLRNQLKLRGEMQVIVVFIIARIEYADGSIWSNEATYKALKAHLDKISP